MAGLHDFCAALPDMRVAEAEQSMLCPRCGRVIALPRDPLWRMLREGPWLMPSGDEDSWRDGCVDCGWKRA